MSAVPAQQAVELLRRLAERRLSEADIAALADRAQTYLDTAPAGCSLDDAFGLSVGRGGEPWYARERREQRDAALCALARRFCRPEMPLRERALWLRHLINRYASTAWPRDRALADMPAHYIEAEREYLFRAFHACSVPSSDRQLLNILRTDPDYLHQETNHLI